MPWRIVCGQSISSRQKYSCTVSRMASIAVVAPSTRAPAPASAWTAAVPCAQLQMLNNRGTVAAASAGVLPWSTRAAANGRVDATRASCTRCPSHARRTTSSPSRLIGVLRESCMQEVAPRHRGGEARLQLRKRPGRDRIRRRGRRIGGRKVRRLGVRGIEQRLAREQRRMPRRFMIGEFEQGRKQRADQVLADRVRVRADEVEAAGGKRVPPLFSGRQRPPRARCRAVRARDSSTTASPSRRASSASTARTRPPRHRRPH